MLTLDDILEILEETPWYRLQSQEKVQRNRQGSQDRFRPRQEDPPQAPQRLQEAPHQRPQGHRAPLNEQQNLLR